MRKSLAVCVAISFALAALAAGSPRAAEKPLILDNLVITLGPTTYRIPHVEIEGASLPLSEMAQLFSGAEKDIDARLARLSARQIVMPSLTTESRSGSNVERATYRKLVLENVAGGRATIARGEGGEETIESPSGDVQRIFWGASVAKGVDLRQLAHVALSNRSDADEPLKPLVEEEVVELVALRGQARKSRGHDRADYACRRARPCADGAGRHSSSNGSRSSIPQSRKTTPR